MPSIVKNDTPEELAQEEADLQREEEKIRTLRHERNSQSMEFGHHGTDDHRNRILAFDWLEGSLARWRADFERRRFAARSAVPA